ncbi:YjzC family protein [Salipaludibacillus daqingensis]|uniref:YjzC family protein n=1 Tax=Salipaludibacillus daqingensis TaxID=3041001 RepID=UPI002473496A|nr:YjzC family protein [Salipaludibacillus daqingensis]
MGQRNQFKAGDKAPNNGVYMEIGETRSMVQDPKQIHLEAGMTFPETTNKDRVWTFKQKPN